MTTIDLSPDLRVALAKAASAAHEATATHPRWQRAVTKALDELLKMDRVEQSGYWLLFRSKSDRIFYYHTAADASACECDGYAFGNPCWHRAAARLLQRAYEIQAQAVLDSE